ncbi:MAG: adenine deaminase [Aggregatilineales bacterium]|nr:adenine deaminase [Chloroflexota bacterium]HOA22519.1 adenine deaminase [Aggregatilineales bacterium]HQE17219.1 adenine deaminase [Aggregatilineales bacterium]
MEREKLIRIARGDKPAAVLLKNANLVNVFTGEVYLTDIAIRRSRIVGLGDGYEAEQVIDLDGKYVAPGYIDAHVHIESSMCTPREFAKAVLPRGVTSVVTDPHEIANVLGLEGISFMLEQAKYGSLSMYVMASSCVPSTHMATAGANLEADDIRHLLNNDWVIGLAEVMNYPGVIMGDKLVLDKLEAFEGSVIDGHAPGLTGKALNAYVAAGVRSDHECTTVEEAREKLRLGMTIFIREATNARNLEALLPLVTPENSHHICFCTDDRQPADLLDQGSIDYMVRVAIQHGIDPVRAIQMGTINTARYFGLHDRGAITIGRRADLFIFSDLYNPVPEIVYRGGYRVAENGKMLPLEEVRRPIQLRNTMNIDWDAVDFTIPANGTRARVIGSIPDQLVTEHRILDVKQVDGCAVADVERDILKMAVIERHRATGNIGKGFIQGIGLKRGAIAGTVAHDHHNLVVIGADDESMMTAAREVARIGGGLVAVDGTQVLAALPLPVAGLMSEAPIGEVRAGMDNLLNAARELGSPLHDPYMAMSFMALEVIPSLKLTDQGLVDVETFEQVDLFVG